MAGIGFNLKKILEGDSFVSSIRAHFYSALISAGPWILSVLTIFVLSLFSPGRLDVFEMTLFRGIIIYAFAFSLIGVGIFHFPLTRYLADKLYAKEESALVPIFNSAATATLLFQGVSAWGFLRVTGLEGIYAGQALMIYMTISLLWLLMIFLTALRDYHAIILSYLAGSIIAILGALWAGRVYGLAGYLGGYLAGHFAIAVLWSGRIFIEFKSMHLFDWNFFSYLVKHKVLLFIGFFYNLAIWIDKIIFWFSPHATEIFRGFRIFPAYDSSVFFAYMTIIPALAVFLLHIETDFYTLYRRYYMTILNRAPLSSIRRIRWAMSARLSKSAGELIRFQGIISLAMILFAPQLAQMLRLPAMQVPIFRITIVAAFLQALFLMVLILILYFDFQKVAFMATGFFLVTNALFTWLTTRMEMLYFGYGYLVAIWLSLVLAFYLIDFRLRNLEYYTFALQPVASHREEEIA